MYCYKINTRLLARCTSFIRRLQRNSSVPATKENQLVDTDIKYPPILDLSRPARKRREREEWHTKVKKLGTVEEKIFELNMPRYYGWKVLQLEEGNIPYDPLPKAQFLTKTHIVEEPKLPSFYDNLLTDEEMDASVQRMKNQIEDALVFEYNYKKQNYQLTKDELEDSISMDNLTSKFVSQQIHRILSTNLAVNYAHLLEAQTDIEPRNEAFWFFGGLETPYETIRSRKGHWARDWSDEPINQNIQYYGKPVLQVRHNLPLKEIMHLKDSEDTSLEVPVEPLDPRKVGYLLKRTRATIIPGFWPGDQNEFGLISYHNRGHLTRRPEQFNDNLDAIKAQAVFGSFSWLYSQACYQGFSTFQDPTYPFVNQMIITNGQWWTFCVYQLNTTIMHMDVINENPRRNICWITEPMKLFDSIENGNIQGFNDNVLKHLIKFYINTPEVKGVEMQPYLSNEKVIAGIEEDERRKWLEDKYKYLVSKRSRHRLVPEIYHWQKIYMIDHNTRFMDKKRDPWQFGINVYKRRLDDHTSEYIPKVCRPYPKSKKKWVTNYYPEVREDKNSSS